MRNLALSLAIAAASFLVAGTSRASVIDDFNRPDSNSLGAGWTQVSGSSSISANEATGSNAALAIFKGGAGNTVSFDVSAHGYSLQYIAAVIGYESGSNNYFFVKVQSNFHDSLFEKFAFYKGNNGGGVFLTLNQAFASGHVAVSTQNTIATLTITPNVGAMQIYSYDYGNAYSSNGIGLGFYGPARADNFGFSNGTNVVPEPTTAALLGLGLLGFMVSRRKSTKSGNA